MGLYEKLEKAQRGDEEAVIDVFVKFQGAIKQQSKRLGYEEAQSDLTIAFLEMIKKIKLENFSLKNEGAIVNYIYLFLKNTSVNLFKKNVLRSIKTSELDISMIADDTSCAVEDKILISRLLSSLPTMQRKVIEMKFIQGFTDKEIGLSLGVSRQAVNKAKNRGLDSLRKALMKME